MNIRYDIGSKLDLSLFKKQASYYIPRQNISYSFFTKHFNLQISILINDNKFYLMETSLISLIRNSENEIINSSYIDLEKDVRFNNLSIIKEMLQHNQSTYLIPLVRSFYSVKDIVDTICMLVTVIFKINELVILL